MKLIFTTKVIGDVQHVYDIDRKTVLVVGTTGLLVAGAHHGPCEVICKRIHTGPSAQATEVGVLHYLSVCANDNLIA